MNLYKSGLKYKIYRTVEQSYPLAGTPSARNYLLREVNGCACRSQSNVLTPNISYVVGFYMCLSAGR